MPLTFSISRYRTPDAGGIQAISPEFSEEYAGILRRGTIFVARSAERVLGFLFVKWVDGRAHYDADVRCSAEIMEAHVDRRFRNQGVATALVAHAIRAARRRGCKAVYLETDDFNRPARRVYERSGFRYHNLIIRYKRTLR